MKNYARSTLLLGAFFIFVWVLFCYSLGKYPGELYSLATFTVLFNILFLMGFRKERVFFDTFLGVLLWLGFWLKFSLRMIFFNGAFNEVAGRFCFEDYAWDLALNLSSCGALGLICASLLREKFLFKYSGQASKRSFDALYFFYQKYRWPLIILFLVVVLFFAGTNLYLGIYQRGHAPRTILPFKLSGIYTWLLLFGFSSFVAVALEFEMRSKSSPYLVSMVGLLETFISSSSLFSRAMIMNVSSLVLGSFHLLRERWPKQMSFHFIIFVAVSFLFLFSSSVLVVNIYRSYNFFDTTKDASEVKEKETPKVDVVPKPVIVAAPVEDRKLNTVNLTKTLFVDRFVGIEGAMAVSSYNRLGWTLWREAWAEKFSNSGASMYDIKIILAPNVGLPDKYHFINLPGIVAFFFYPGSYLFLFFSMIVVGLFGAGVEILTYKIGGANPILCALFAQVISYRYSNFGYVPAQSYLLVGTIVLNLLIIYFAEKICQLILAKKNVTV